MAKQYWVFRNKTWNIYPDGFYEKEDAITFAQQEAKKNPGLPVDVFYLEASFEFGEPRE